MTWLYATLLTILAAAFILTPFMKRAGEQEWARHQEQLRMQQFSAALRAIGVHISEMQRAFLEMAEVAAKAGKKLELAFRRKG